MSVSEHLMATGTWDLELRPDTPYSITDRLALARAGFSHIHITRTAFNAVEVGAGGLWDLAIYSGVYRRQEGRTRFSGPGAVWWAGGEQEEGDRAFAPWLWNASLADSEYAVTQIEGHWASLFGAGGDPFPFRDWQSLTNLAGTRTVADFAGTIRERMDLICSLWTGLEWRCNPDVSVDFGTAADLYGTTPRLLLSPEGGGVESGLIAAVAEIQPVAHLEQWCSILHAISSSGTGIHGITPTYVNANGDTVRLTVEVYPTDVDAADLTAYATSLHQAGRDSWQWELSVKADVPILADVAPVGSYVYLYDPLQDVVDLANQVTLRGQTVSPVKARLVGATWPITAGMGVYVRSSDDESIVDLTDWVAWESPGVDLELGLPKTTLGNFLTQRR